MNYKIFFNQVKKGFHDGGTLIGIVVNTVFLSVIYIIAVGLTSLISRIKKKKFIDDSIDESAKTYWVPLNLGKKKKEEYHRQF